MYITNILISSIERNIKAAKADGSIERESKNARQGNTGKQDKGD
jgi:hypothetical protein